VPDRHTEPHFETAALITIDTQRDLLDDGSFPIAGTTAALPNMQRLLDAFRAAEREIVHIVRLYEPDGSNAERCRRDLLAGGAQLVLTGTPGSQLPNALLPRTDLTLDHEALLRGEVQRLTDRETVIYKPRWGAFYRTPLEEHLRGCEVSTLVFSGCNFPNCPRTSIYEACERDFRVVLARDAISGLYERGERELRAIGVVLLDSDDVVAAAMRSVAAV
jgi:nicotinamidase-related amidase